MIFLRYTWLIAAVCSLYTLGSVHAQSLAPAYSGSYTLTNLGSVPGVPTNYGGVAFLDNNTLLLGGSAMTASGAIYSIAVTRDANHHVNGFSGPAALYKNAPFSYGGLAFGPGGVLFATATSANSEFLLLQYAPGGGLNPDKVINLNSLGSPGNRGTLQFVPAGYGIPDAGGFRLANFGNFAIYSSVLTPDGLGTYNLSPLVAQAVISGSPSGMAYVPPGSPVFNSLNRYLLITEFGSARVAAYQLDANGFPIVATRDTFISGFNSPEGAILDPVTSDVLFSTFGGGNQIVVVSGFVSVPEPSTLVLAGSAGLMFLGGWVWRRQGKRTSFALFHNQWKE